MAEIDAVLSEVPLADEGGKYRGPEGEAVLNLTLSDTAIRIREADNSGVFLPFIGDYGGRGEFSAGYLAHFPGLNLIEGGRRFIGPTVDGHTVILEGLYNNRDKLPRIGIVQTLGGTPIVDSEILVIGLKHTEITKTDDRGIWWKYLEIDTYDDLKAITKKGIVYEMVTQKEVEEYIYNQGCKKITRPGGFGLRMISRDT
jgi:hypothetical protein